VSSSPVVEAVVIERMKKCLLRAIDIFNQTDAGTLLCPRKDESGNDAKKGSAGWGAASERAIAHRLAVYIENEFRKVGLITDTGPVVVDCEYNRHLDGAKIQRIPDSLKSIVEKAKRRPKPDSDDDGFYVFSVAPDIVVHERGNDKQNLLVVEVKKTTNLEIPEYDRLKLECFTNKSSDYGYKLGAVVAVEDNLAPGKRCLLPPKWFLNGVAVE